MTATPERRARLPRLPLRHRVGLSLAVVSTAITGLLAAVTWNLASGYLVEQREDTAIQRATVNARLVQASLGQPPGDGLEDLLTGLAAGPETTVALRSEGSWTAAGRDVDLDTLPDVLLDRASTGIGQRQRITAAGLPVLAVAMALPEDRVLYVELVSLTELDRTLRFLSAVLVVGVGVSALLGLALGHWVARRALAPVTELTEAAARVAAGELDTRLPEHRDSDLAELALTFNRTADALAARVRRDARFAADVSHELRSPLTTLINAVAVLDRRRDELPAPAAQAVELLVGDVHRFHRMVTDLLEIAKADSGMDRRDADLCNLGDLAVRAVRERRAAVPVRVEGAPGFVLGDRRRLDRVIGNLLDNADTHGGGATAVAVCRCTGGAEPSVRLVVEDAGPGIPVALRGEVFERFSRGTLAGSRGDDGGSGLGLALVARHVRDHDGRVWIEDRDGGGARVVVELPEVSP